MNAFFKPLLLASLVLLAAAAQYFTYAAYVAPREDATQSLQAMTELLQLENRKKPGYRAPENRGVTIPDLLSRVQELAAQSAVKLVSVEPIAGDADQYRLTLLGSYGSFLEFLARFETLQVAIAGFDVTPSADAAGLLDVALDFGHTTAPNTIRAERIGEFRTRLKTASLRDPFNPGSGPIQLAADSNTDDLTWAFNLTSISEIGKSKYATIDGKDYNVGDDLQGLKIRKIGADSVTLIQKENGKERERFLRFRTAPEDHT
jgi:hypothetical protein